MREYKFSGKSENISELATDILTPNGIVLSISEEGDLKHKKNYKFPKWLILMSKTVFNRI